MHHAWETPLASYTGRFSFDTSLYMICLRFAGVWSKCTPSWWSCNLNQPKGCIHSAESSALLADVEQSHHNLAGRAWGLKESTREQFYSSQAQDMQLLALCSGPRQPQDHQPFQQEPRLAGEPRQNLGSSICPQRTLGSSVGDSKSFRVTAQSEFLCMTRPYMFALNLPFLKPIAVFQCLWPWCRSSSPENINICALELMRKTLL